MAQPQTYQPAQSDSVPSAPHPLMTLQNLILAEPGLCAEPAMFVHRFGKVHHDPASDSYRFAQGAAAVFDTYFNLFNFGKWRDNCKLDGLWLGLTGDGRVEVKVFHTTPDLHDETLATTLLTLSTGQEALIDLSHLCAASPAGLIYFSVRALGSDVSLSAARFATAGLPDPERRLALCITTFRRERQVEDTARRLALYLDQAEFSAFLTVLIIDNGDSATIPPHPQITRIPNRNLGGAGGFSRGLLEAAKARYSHVLFMDDDAAFPVEALHRSFAYLSLATDPRTAIAGAMVNTTDTWQMWENTAIFDRKCRPLDTETDLRRRDEVVEMEFASTNRHTAKMYGGWWFFAFPLAAVRHMPFPFFVRGDDVNFCLANDFRVTTLNGVVAFADDFIYKETPLTWYLDLRSHMVHHLTLARMEIGRFRLAWIGVLFFLRNLLKFHYETTSAVLMAWQHVLQGPDFFAKNPDAAGPRAAIRAMTHEETWQSIPDLDLTEVPGFLGRKKTLRRVFPYFLNGHFLPFYRFWGGRRVIFAAQRGHLDLCWGAHQLTYLSTQRDKAYVTRRSDLRALGLLCRMLLLWLRLVFGYGRLRALYRKRFPEITSAAYWQDALAMPQTPPDTDTETMRPYPEGRV